MKHTKTKIYVKVSSERNEIVCSGIEFAEFIKYLPQPIENLIIITGGSNAISLETRFERGLEVFDGYGLVKKLTKENVHTLGGFCFIDYAPLRKTSDLSEQQIAELLYLGHMFKPLHSPFFEELQNRFVYLAHDDGWYCKLYSKNLNDFICVLSRKIMDTIGEKFYNCSSAINDKLLELSESGILIDLGEILQQKGEVVRIYTVGEYSNMDIVQNDFQKIRNSALKVHSLYKSEEGWMVL